MTYAKNSTITAIHRPITNGMYSDTYTVIYSNGIRRNYTIKGAMNKKHFEFIQSATVESRYSKHTGKHTSDVFTAPVEPQEEPATEEPAAEEPTTTDTPATEEPATNNEEVNTMKKRFFYLADINTTFTVTPMTKKEIICIGQELQKLCAFISDDQTISGYTKDGRFFYYDNSNFDSFKKSDIINAVSVIYSDESGDYYWGGFDINEWGVANPTEDGGIIIADHDNIKEVESADYSETAEETEEEPAEVQTAAEQPEEIPDFEAVKNQLFAKVEHITADFPSKSEIVYRTHGEDIAHTIWIDNGVNPPERLSRAALDSWEKSGIVEERHIFEIAMENTMAKQKPRIHAGTMFYNPDADSLSNSALLESCFNRQNLDKHSDILVTTSEQNNGAIALFYPPVCEKICELLHGAGFYVAFTSKNEGIVHKLDHLEVSAIRRNLQSTNRMFNPADTLTDEVFYYDPIIKRLIPESKTADFEVLRRQVLKGFA